MFGEEDRDRAVLEVERRREAASQRKFLEVLTDFEPEKFTHLLEGSDIKEEQPKVFLANFVHRGTRPRSTTPGLRILGGFRSEQQAVEYAKTKIYPNYPHCDLRCGFLNEWIPILATNEKLFDKEFTDAKVKTLLQNYFDTLKKHQDEFLENVNAKKTGKTGLSAQAKKTKATKKVSARKKALDASSKEVGGLPNETFVPPYPASLMIANQRYAAVIFVLDEHPDAIKGKRDSEPMFMVLRMYEDREAAEKDIRDDLSLTIREFAIDVVDLYEFLFPDAVDQSEIETEYRDPELNSIMKAKREQPKNVEKFKKVMKQKKKEVKEIDITPADKDLPDGAKITVPSLDIKTEVKATKNSDWVPAASAPAAESEQASSKLKKDQRDEAFSLGYHEDGSGQ